MKGSRSETTNSQVPPPARAAVEMAKRRPLHRWLAHVARGVGMLAASLYQ